MKATAIIEKGHDGTYDVNLEFDDRMDYGLFGEGETVKSAIEDFYESYAEMRDLYREENRKFVECVFDFKYDMASFLAFYSNIMTLAGLERLTGVSQGQLSHYVNGVRKPSKKTIEKIEKRLHEFGKDLSKIEFV